MHIIRESKYRSITALLLLGTVTVLFLVFKFGYEQETVYADHGECNDGIDNDGDGLIDWEYDLGCYNEHDMTEGALSRDEEAGWTTHNPSADTRIVYVSSSVGNNAWTGLCPDVPMEGDCGPKQTLVAGMALIRNGYPDWLLLRRGDTWRNEYFGASNVWSSSPSGRSSEERIVIASYGSSTARPILELEQAQQLWNISYVAIHDIEIYNYGKDVTNEEFNGENDTGFRILYENIDLLIENIHLRHAWFTVQSIAPDYFNNIEIRRNIVEKNYSIHSHAQGIFSSTLAPNYLLIEDNVWHQNGWSDDFRLVLTQPNIDIEDWKTISDGRFQITLEGIAYDIDSLDFTGAVTMDDVANIIEARINVVVDEVGAVDVDWTTLGEVFVVKSAFFESDSDYSIDTYGGGIGGTDIDGVSWLNKDDQGVPESTIFNRNLYLSYGYGSTTVRGNIDADGASGGMQLRMGGLAENNLYLRNPHAITLGHAENPVESTTGGIIRNNVVLGARDIDTQVQGSGIGAGGQYIADLAIYGNIVAQNVLGTGNIKGLYLTSVSPMTDVSVHDNIVYDWGRPVWPNPSDTRGFGLIVNVHEDSSNVSVYNNDIQQVNGGFVADTTTSSTLNALGVLSNNRYFSTSPNPPVIWSSGWFSFNTSVTSDAWFLGTGDTGSTLEEVVYPDPDRTVETYMASLGETATYEAFMIEAKERSRFNDRQEFTAQATIDYIREGFGLDPISSDTTPPTLTETTPVATPTTDTTPSYTFNSTESGTITYGGSCTSGTTNANSGANTIIFNTLSTGTYTNCTIMVTDAADNESNTLAVTAFTITAASSGGGGGGGGSSSGSKKTTTTTTATSTASTTVPVSVPAGGGGSSQGVTLTKDLYLGMEDAEVLLLQKFLNANNFTIASTGPGSKGNETNWFGPATQQAVIKYQNTYKDTILIPNGLTTGNGYVGAATRAHMKGGTTATGPSLSELIALVAQLQAQLAELLKAQTPASTASTPSTPTTPITTPTTGLYRQLWHGEEGEDVRTLQTILKNLGLLTTDDITGYYGRNTITGVQQYQCQKNIVCTGSDTTTGWGMVGPTTLKMLQGE